VVVPKISAQQQRKIEIMLAKWVGKLTWDALVAKVELELGGDFQGSCRVSVSRCL
jgi:hypothetical protein